MKEEGSASCSMYAHEPSMHYTGLQEKWKRKLNYIPRSNHHLVYLMLLTYLKLFTQLFTLWVQVCIPTYTIHGVRVLFNPNHYRKIQKLEKKKRNAILFFKTFLKCFPPNAIIQLCLHISDSFNDLDRP